MNDTTETSVRPSDFYVTSMYGYRTKQPLVSVKLGDVAVQVTPEKAREMAAMLVEAAESADQDGFIMEWFSTFLDLDEAKTAQVMGEYRAWRNRQRLQKGIGMLDDLPSEP